MVYKRAFNLIKEREFFVVFVLAVVLSFVVFGNGISGDFVFDDVSVVKNRGDLKDIGNFFNLFTSSYHQNMPKTGLFRPFTMATYSLNHNVLGSSSVGFHVINIIIHALNSFLVFWLIKWLLKSRVAAYISFLLFLLHPIHTEAVTSIVGRAELLAFFWSLITIYFFSKNDKILAGTAFLFALASKEVALMVLPVIFYTDIFFLDKNWRKAVTNNLFFILPLVLYSFLRYLALGQYFVGDIKTTIAENVLKFVSFPERIFTALKVLFLYTEKLIWPVHLSADYSYNAIPIVKNIFASPYPIAGLIVLAGLVFILISGKTRGTGFGFGAAVFLFPYLMISNLIVPIGTIMGERLMYFPSLGFIVVAALIIVKFLNEAPQAKPVALSNYGQSLVALPVGRNPAPESPIHPRVEPVAFWGVDKEKIYKIAGYSLLAFLVVFYGVRTFIRNKDWRDSRTLFYATLKESPNSLVTRTALAGVYIRADEWEKAKEQLEIAREIYEDNSHLQNLLGIVADHNGNYDFAEARYKKSLELNPDAINSYINLAELYLKQGRLEEAGNNFQKVIDFYPVTEYVMRYSYIQIALEKPDDALKTIKKYFGNNYNHPDISALVGTAFFVKGDYQQALIYLKKARELGNRTLEIIEMTEIAEGKQANVKLKNQNE